MKRIYLGRHVYGLAAIAFGVISFVWHDFGAPWQQIQVLGNIPHRELLVYIAAAVEIIGGLAIQWRRTARAGAIVLGVIFLLWALLWVPRIIAEPGVYDRYGNFFEQFSIVSGAIVTYATLCSDKQRADKLAHIGSAFFGVCVISFTLEQLFYLRATAQFVPQWIPLGQMFWAIATTVFFGLAAVALLSRRAPLLASVLTTAMITGFQVSIWIPAPFANPHQLMNWVGNAQNLAIGGAAWIIADYLSPIRADRDDLQALTPAETLSHATHY